MKKTLLVALAALVGGIHSADAAILLYDLKGTVAGKWTASFTLDTSRTPSPFVANNFTRFNGLTITFTRPNSTVVETAALPFTGATFQTLINQGGIFLGNLGNAVPFQTQFAVYGPQLYSGPESAPTLLTGPFDLSDVPRSRLSDPIQVNYRLTVTDVTGQVPEPATWAMMLIGFGAIGTAIRRRRAVATRVIFA